MTHPIPARAYGPPSSRPFPVVPWRCGGAILSLIGLIALTGRAGAAEVTYAKDIQPILADRCYSCHGPEKQKGELRLDSPAAIRKGGKNGDVLTAGDPAKSPLYTLTLLPGGDDDRMPAKGDPLTQAQTDALREWIKTGASFDGVAVVIAKAEPVTAPVHLGPSDIDVASAKLGQPDAGALKALTEAGAVIRPLSGNGAALDVDLSHLSEALGAKHLKQLDAIATHVFWLDLHGTAISDDGLATVAKCRHLTRLHLGYTAISDRGLMTLKALVGLQYLNLVATPVGDVGLANLSGLKKLERLFLMQSKVTDTGAATLAKALPDLVINRGPHFSTVVVAEPEGAGKRKKKP